MESKLQIPGIWSIGCMCLTGLFLLLMASPIMAVYPVEYVSLIGIWCLGCVLMYWIKAYRDVMVARATGRVDAESFDGDIHDGEVILEEDIDIDDEEG